MEHRKRPANMQQNSPRTRRWAGLKFVVLLLLCALPVGGSVALLINGTGLPSAIYLGMSLLTFFLYWRDKRQARADGWRTPEKVLHAMELFGGWPGALIAQQVFRHKTRKVSFQLVFWLIVLVHEVVWIDRLFLGGNYLTRHFF